MKLLARIRLLKTIPAPFFFKCWHFFFNYAYYERSQYPVVSILTKLLERQPVNYREIVCIGYWRQILWNIIFYFVLLSLLSDYTYFTFCRSCILLHYCALRKPVWPYYINVYYLLIKKCKQANFLFEFNNSISLGGICLSFPHGNPSTIINCCYCHYLTSLKSKTSIQWQWPTVLS